mmetsp:Transcript_10719/g.28378  ORF Transcript_10719/g.28378 Transcript_10719/m.28378 type:complete len:151 (-) Transcript_10719:39-491(-)
MVASSPINWAEAIIDEGAIQALSSRSKGVGSPSSSSSLPSAMKKRISFGNLERRHLRRRCFEGRPRSPRAPCRRWPPRLRLKNGTPLQKLLDPHASEHEEHDPATRVDQQAHSKGSENGANQPIGHIAVLQRHGHRCQTTMLAFRASRET